MLYGGFLNMAELGFRVFVELLVGIGVIGGAVVWLYKCARKVNQVMDFLAAEMKPNGGASMHDLMTHLQATAESNNDKIESVIERLDTHIAHHNE